KPVELDDGLYTINYRVLEEDGFKKSYIGNLMEAPADLKIADETNTVTITLDDSIKKFQIEQDGQFEKLTINTENNVSFVLDSLDEVVKTKVSVESDEGNTTDEIVYLHFEQNRVDFVEALPGVEDDENEEQPEVPEVTEEAYTVGY